ncbi:MAG: NADH-quinone oxidoreductase subunit C [Nitrospinota bacterium]|nr:NADH-quinone oxidoreductase subunit C [Nitrospinota bacterium]MDH5755918.1 NADH-quinone oxidoreductase subunit C [Nitrospinota bacterium]
MSEEKNSGQGGVSDVMARAKAVLGPMGVLIHTHCQHGDDTLVVQAEDILKVMEFLREDKSLRFDMMMDLTAVDYLGAEEMHPYLKPMKARFEVVYHLYSIEKNHRIRVKVPLTEESPFVDSITGIWVGADWFEREAWDLYGVVFRGHPNLKRILLYEEFEGHPLRKDYGKMKRQPLIGPVN